MALTGAERARRYREARKAGIPLRNASKQWKAPSAELVAAFERDLPKLTRYTRAKLYGAAAQQDAADIAAQVALRFSERGGAIRDAKNVPAWAGRVVRSLLADRGREDDKEALRVRAAELEASDDLPTRRKYRGPRVDDDEDDQGDDHGEPTTDEDRALIVGARPDSNPYHQPEDDNEKAATLGAPNLLCRDSTSDRWLARFVVGPINRRGGLPVRVLRPRQSDQLLLERTA